MNKPVTMWKKTSGAYQSSAKVVDGNLILSLPDAINPVVWRMELGSVKASALEVKTDAANGVHTLALKTPKGEVHEIAPYADRDAAVEALMRVSAALQSAEGRISPSVPATTDAGSYRDPAAQPLFIRPDRSALKWMLALAGVLAVIFLFAYWARMDSGIVPADGPPLPESATSTRGQSNAESGVPQSADDLLRGY